MYSLIGSDQMSTEAENEEGCTSFSVAADLTLDGEPVSGQNKDTGLESLSKYIVLKMRIKDGPAILVLAYPGELLGYGMWSTGMSLMRNNLYSRTESETGLSFKHWGLLALGSTSVGQAVETAREFGLAGSGSLLISDSSSESVSVEFNAGGLSVIPPQNGISVHANHPVGKETSPFENYPDKLEMENSRYRMEYLYDLLNAERGRLTPQKALMCLADHSRYPRGICRHMIGESKNKGTTAAVIAEPTKGKLHVVRGNPCCNWPTTYTI
jgi:isopenicillin-N N-acyltransferase-like protein